MKKEVGSDFYYLPSIEPTKEISSSFHANVYFISGRTVLDFIVNNIKDQFHFKKILIPSYSCETMIIPFLDNQIKIGFYDVLVDRKGIRVKVDNIEDTHAIIVMNYFGFESPAIEKFISEMASREITVIKDATQSLFSEERYDSRADYIFASLRKWMGVPDGALLTKRDRRFNIPLPDKTHEAYVNTRLQAMQMKETYLNRNVGSKEDYLRKFAEAAEILKKDYANYRMSDQSIEMLQYLDTELLIERRKQNASFLLTELRNVSQLNLIFNEVKKQDVPLFVPIIVKNGKRDKLRQYLISKEIYCPVHWPLSKWHTISEKSKEIYHQELSLVCDQRYNLKNMARIVQEIKNFFNTN